MALKRNIPEEYMDYDYGFTGVSEEEYRKKETEADRFLFDETNTDVGDFYEKLRDKNKEGDNEKYEQKLQ